MGTPAIKFDGFMVILQNAHWFASGFGWFFASPVRKIFC
jgi:hypothetical protein